MLNPQKDRLGFRELFAPEKDFHLDFAIGTTYSCDLEALIGAYLTFGLLVDPEGQAKENHVSRLRAIREATGKLALFCQAGQILTALKATAVYSLLEEAVFQVCPAKKGNSWPSFHPKVWVARYQQRKKRGEKRLHFTIGWLSKAAILLLIKAGIYAALSAGCQAIQEPSINL